MEKIEWSEDFSVGVESIDAQHKTLIEMTNKLIDTPNVPSNSDTITELLNDMIKYATTHFVDEERWMSYHNYADFPAHQEQHMEFMKKTSEFCDIEEGSVVIDNFSDTVLRYLRDWWVNHILSEDMKLKPIATGDD